MLTFSPAHSDPSAEAPSPSTGAGLPVAMWGVVVFGMLAALAIFNPGFMSYDTIEQLKQARTGRFGDWHPPFMAFTWRALEWFVVGPLGMLLLQVAAWWGGVALVVHHLAPRRLAPWLALLLGFWPPVFTMVGTIWKDVQMTSALTLAAGLLLAHRTSRGPWVLAGAIAALFYAGAMRHNAATSVLPLALWAGWAVAVRIGMSSRLTRAGTALGLTAVLIVAPALTNKVLVSQADPPIEQALLAWDLLGTSVFAGVNLLPRDLEPRHYTVTELKRKYFGVPLTASVAHHHPEGLRLRFVDRDGMPTYRKRWLQAIQAHPLAYLQHRADLLRTQLGLVPAVFYPFHWMVDPNPLRVSWRPSEACVQYLTAIHGIKDSLFFRTWLYLVMLLACGLLAVKALRQGRKNAAVAVVFVVGGWLNFLPLLVISLGGDLRYSLWTIICALFATLATWSALRHAEGPDAA